MHFLSEMMPLQGTTQTFKHGKTLRTTKHALIVRNVAPARHHPDLKKWSMQKYQYIQKCIKSNKIYLIVLNITK